jgi:hypothetical protein
MDLDTQKIDDAVLALVLLGWHDNDGAWKGFDRDSLDRLHQARLYQQPAR